MRVAPMVVVVVLVVVSYAPTIAWMAIAKTKAALVATEVILAIARVLEQLPKNFQIEYGHIHPKKWMG